MKTLNILRTSILCFVLLCTSNYILTAQCSGGGTLIASQEFEDPYASQTGLTYTSTIAPCTISSDIWDLSTSLSGTVANPNGGSQFWGIRDLQGNCSGGTESLTFTQTIPGGAAYSAVEFCFYYGTQGFDTTDEFNTTVSVDNGSSVCVEETESFGNSTTTAWTQKCYTVPVAPGDIVSLEIEVTQNGGSDYAGIDDVTICESSATPASLCAIALPPECPAGCTTLLSQGFEGNAIEWNYTASIDCDAPDDMFTVVSSAGNIIPNSGNNFFGYEDVESAGCDPASKDQTLTFDTYTVAAGITNIKVCLSQYTDVANGSEINDGATFEVSINGNSQGVINNEECAADVWFETCVEYEVVAGDMIDLVVTMGSTATNEFGGLDDVMLCSIDNPPPCDQANVVISEIDTDAGSGDASSGEWFELHCQGPGDCDISGYYLTNGEFLIKVPDGTIIPAGGYYTVGSNLAATGAGITSVPEDHDLSANGGYSHSLDLQTCGCSCINGIWESTSLCGDATVISDITLDNGAEQLLVLSPCDLNNPVHAVVWGGGDSLPISKQISEDCFGSCGAPNISIPSSTDPTYWDYSFNLRDIACTTSYSLSDADGDGILGTMGDEWVLDDTPTPGLQNTALAYTLNVSWSSPSGAQSQTFDIGSLEQVQEEEDAIVAMLQDAPIIACEGTDVSISFSQIDNQTLAGNEIVQQGGSHGPLMISGWGSGISFDNMSNAGGGTPDALTSNPSYTINASGKVYVRIRELAYSSGNIKYKDPSSDCQGYMMDPAMSSDCVMELVFPVIMSGCTLEPSILVTKDDADNLDDTQEIQSGSDADFTITVINDGDEGLTNVVIVDNQANAASCELDATQTATMIMNVGNMDAILDPGESFSYPCNSIGGITSFPYTNSITVSAEGSTSATAVMDDDPTTVTQSPASISITKDDNDNSDDTQEVASGSDATFSITVTNDGSVILENIQLSDPATSSCALSVADIEALILAQGNMDEFLDPTESFTFTCSTTGGITSPFVNEISVTANPEGDNDTEISDDDPTEITVAGVCSILITDISTTCNADGTYNLDLTFTHTNPEANALVDIDLAGLASMASVATTGASQTVSFTNVANGDGTNGLTIAITETGGACNGSLMFDEPECLVEFNCPAITTLNQPADPCQSGSFDLTASGFNAMHMNQTSGGGPFGIEFKAFSGATAPADAYTGGTSLGIVANAALTMTGTEASITGVGGALTAGDYQICAILSGTPTDADCRPQVCVPVTVNPQPACSITTTSVSCNGESDGRLSLHPISAPYPLTIMWISGGTTIATTNTATSPTPLDLSNLPAGHYQVFFTDANGCTTTCTGEITEPDPAADMQDLNLCVGDSGSILVEDTELKEDKESETSIIKKRKASLSESTFFMPGYSSSNTNVVTVDASGNVFAVGPGVATITYTDASGCTADATVTVHGGSDVTVGPFCQDDIVSADDDAFTIDIAATPPPGAGFTGVWSAASASVNFINVDPANGTATLNYTNLIPGRYPYMYTLSDASGTICSVNFEFLVNYSPRLPDITIPECGTFRIDLNIDLDDSESEDIGKKSLSGFSSSDPSVATVETVNDFLGIVTGVSPGTATITYMDPNGCMATSMVTVTAKDFACTITPVSETMCDANDGQLMVNVTDGVAPYSYSIDGGTTTTTNNPITGLAPGNYTVLVTDNTGCTTECSATIPELGIATCTAGSNSPVCVGATLNLTETGGDGTSWSWSGPNSFSSTDQNPTISSVSAATAGTYTVVVTDSNGCASSCTTDVALYDLPAISGVNGCEGGMITLSPSGTPASVSPWVTANSSIATVTDAGVVSLIAEGSTTVTFTDVNGCQDTESIVVRPSPTMTLENTTICYDNSTMYDLSTLEPAGMTGGQWRDDMSNNLASTLVTPVDGAMYSYTFTNSFNCPVTETTTLTVVNQPDITDIDDVELCSGESFILPTISGTNLTGNQAYWTMSNTSGSTFVVGSPITTTQTIYIHDSNASASDCFDEESFVVTVNAIPSVNTGANIIACGATVTSGGDFNFSDAEDLEYGDVDGDGADGSTAIVTYYNNQTDAENAMNPLSDGTGLFSAMFYARVEDANGCFSIIQLTRELFIDPNYTATPTSPTICGGSDGSIDFTGLEQLAGYQLDYTTPSGTNVTGVNINSDASGNYSLTGLSPGAYTGIVIYTVRSTEYTCSGPTISVTITDPGITANTIEDIEVCFGATSAPITLTTTDPEITHFKLDFDAAAIAAGFTVMPAIAMTAGATITIPGTATPGVYSGEICLVYSNSCQVTDPFTITILENPVATVNNIEQCFSTSASTPDLILTSTVGTPTNYTIAYDAAAQAAGLVDVTTSSSTSSATYSIPANLAVGSYMGTITYSDADACSGTDDFTITIIENPVATVNNIEQCFSTSASTPALTLLATVGTPTNYTIAYDAAAQAAGLVDVTTASSTASANYSIPANLTAGTYDGTITYSDANGCSGTDDFTITIKPNPVATIDDIEVCGTASNFPFSVNVSSGTIEHFTVAFNAAALAAGLQDMDMIAMTSGAQFTSTTNLPVGTYNGVITLVDANACTVDDPFTITIHPLPVLSIDNPQICYDGTTLYDLTTLEPAGMTGGMWFDFAFNLVDPPQVIPGDGHGYNYTFTDSNGCSATENIVLNITTEPVIDIADQDYCSTVTSVDLTALEPAGLTGGTWSNGSGNLADPTNVDPSTGPFTYTYAAALGCGDSDVVNYNPIIGCNGAFPWNGNN